jgi:acyl carrier protein
MLAAEQREHRIRAIATRLAKGGDAGTVSGDADLFREVGIASSAALELLLSLEDEFSIQVPDADFNEARTVNALVALVARLET